MSKNWYVFTGPPSSGKSTIIRELSKLGYKTFEEVGRQLIDRELAAGKSLREIGVDSPVFERRFVETQRKLEALVSQTETVIFDRGILDTLPFFKYYGWAVPDEIQRYCSQANYNKSVFLFELLDYDKDYARVETEETAKKMQVLFGQVYEEAGYNVIFIPKDTIKNRLAAVLKHLP